MLDRLKTDIRAIREQDPAARSTAQVIFLYSGLHAVMLHRPAHWLYNHKRYFLARFISQFSRLCTGIEIHPGAKLGKGIFIDHGSGVVIGETAEVGDFCTIYQGATLGGTGKDVGKRHPTLGDHVMVGTGAKILGPFRVGDGAKIAANAVVLEPVPDDCTAVGVPARIVRRGGEKVVSQDLDQVHIPDPVSQELCRMQMMIDRLQKQLNELEQSKERNEEAK